MRNGKKRTRAEWKALVEESKASELTQKAFAESRGLSPTTLSRWTSRLRREAQAALVAVDIVADAPATAPARDADFRVALAAMAAPGEPQRAGVYCHCFAQAFVDDDPYASYLDLQLRHFHGCRGDLDLTGSA